MPDDPRPEAGISPEEKLFWVLLTIFGALFATGTYFIVVDHVEWGSFYTVVGLGGLLMLIRERLRPSLKKVPIRTLLTVVASISVSVLVVQLVVYVVTVRSNLDLYVMPRTLTADQVSAIKSAVSSYDLRTYDPHAVVNVVYSITNEESGSYANDLLQALRGAGWDAHAGGIDPWSVNPNTKLYGPAFDNNMLVILEEGIDIRVSDPGVQSQSDPNHPPPDVILERALDAANIRYGGGAGRSKEGYFLTIIVCRRPYRLGPQHRDLLGKLIQWVARVIR